MFNDNNLGNSDGKGGEEGKILEERRLQIPNVDTKRGNIVGEFIENLGLKKFELLQIVHYPELTGDRFMNKIAGYVVGLLKNDMGNGGMNIKSEVNLDKEGNFNDLGYHSKHIRYDEMIQLQRENGLTYEFDTEGNLIQ